MAELEQKIESTSKRVEELKAKIKDKDAFKAAKQSVESYTSQLGTLREQLKEAVENYEQLKDEGASKDALKDARESVKSLKIEVKAANENLKKAKAELADFDPKILEKAKRELKGYKTSLEQIQAVTVGVNKALLNLDKASPRELEKTLKALNRELKNAPQNSEAYKILAGNIRAVKEQLAEIREELEDSMSPWEKFKAWATSAWPAIDLISRGFDLAVDKMREYVDAYAEMDQEMSSVIKFTGMSARDVDVLNKEFRSMDTRTSREQLNMLAQEAGRLGKQSVEEVLGFVRAADKINVALDDLGRGATLTLSKLAGTFGVEEIFGTEESLLKVGSVINELSQNCSASAPYLADFTERMAGVGAQAGMTIQQIMGIGAVLDSSSQAVEASSTAVSQVLVRLYQDPAKYARVAGLEVESFAKLLKEDANEAFILFLQTLGKAGGMDVLSPMFKDMGETGAHAISALSILADKIDEVKAQQQVASEAFREGASVGREFDVQNNTVQAGLEKVKNAAHEFQVQLGEKLYPLVQHFLSSTSSVMRALLVLVSYIYEHRASVIALGIAYVAYRSAVNMAMISEKAHAAGIIAKKSLMAAYTAAVKLATVAVSLLTLNFTKARAAWRAFSLALKASPIGLAAAAVAFLAAKIIAAVTATDEFRESMQSAMKSATSFSEEARKEIRELDNLFGKLQGAKKGTKEYDDAKKSIISKYGIYLQGLIDEKGEIINLTMAYDRLTWAAKRAAQVRGVNAARESLDAAFFKEVDDITEKIRDKLSSEGMSDRQVSRLVTSISQSIASGNDIAKADRDEIFRFENLHRSSFAGIFGDKSAMSLVHELRAKNTDYLRRSEKLSSMDTRHFSSMDSEELASQIEKISKALESSPQNAIDVSISVNDDDAAQKIREAVGRKGGSSEPKSPGALPAGAQSSLPAEGGKQSRNAIFDTSSVKGYALSISKGVLKGGESLSGTLSREQAETLLRELMFEQSLRGMLPGGSASVSGDGSPLAPGPGKPDKQGEERFAAEKAWRERQEAEARIAYAKGEDTYTEHTLKMKEIAEKYNQMLLSRDDLTASERLKIQADHWESVNSLTRAGTQREVDRETKSHEDTLSNLKKAYAERLSAGEISAEERKQLERQYQESIELEELRHLAELLKIYKDGSEEKLKTQQKYLDAELAAAKRHQEELERIRKEEEERIENERRKQEDTQKRVKSLPGEKDKGDVGNKIDSLREDFEKQKEVLDQALYDGDISLEDYNARLERMQRELAHNIVNSIADIKSEWASLSLSMIDAWKKFAESLKDGDPFDGLQKGIGATAALMSSVMQQLSAFTQAELSVQTAKIESRYEREIQLAEGNSYRIAKLEKQKEQDIAKAKNDASRKMFAMQVIQAVAQTAQNAVEGFGAGLQAGFPMALWLAPALAAIATAQGAVQIALIKKQQQASESQGFSEGGFTKPGRVDEPAGIVHAGEWVASQRLLASPVARPMIEALDYAQRTNTIGSLRSQDVSRSITATQSLSMAAESHPSAAVIASAIASGSGAVSRLIRRLDEPFVTVNTVTGPAGIKQAEDEYLSLMRNKAPRSRRKNLAPRI